MKVCVFRHPAVHGEIPNTVLSELVDKTTYQRQTLRENAPQTTDCLTSIYYIYKRVFEIDLLLTFIGDLPRRLLTSSQWKLLFIEREKAQPGDLLFVKNKAKRKLQSHAAMILGPDRIFHCSPELGTASIESDQVFFEKYEQKLSPEESIRYTDPRNTALRKRYRTFIPKNYMARL